MLSTLAKVSMKQQEKYFHPTSGSSRLPNCDASITDFPPSLRLSLPPSLSLSDFPSVSIRSCGWKDARVLEITNKETDKWIQSAMEFGDKCWLFNCKNTFLKLNCFFIQPFFEACLEFNNRIEAEKYVPRVLPENKVACFIKIGYGKFFVAFPSLSDILSDLYNHTQWTNQVFTCFVILELPDRIVPLLKKRCETN